jgi:hypothetical protein
LRRKLLDSDGFDTRILAEGDDRDLITFSGSVV